MTGAATSVLCPPVVGCSPLSSIGGSIAGDAASSVFSALTSWLASGAQGLVNHVLTLITTPTGASSSAGGVTTSALTTTSLRSVATVSSSSPTDPSLGVTWFAQQETLMLELMGLVMLPILLISTIGAIVRQDLARLARTWLMALPLALICAFVGVELTQTGLDLTDALSSAVLSSVDLSKTIGSAITDTSITGAADGAVVSVVIACLAILGGLLLWLELVLRTAAVYIALLFLPLAMAGLVWPTTARMAKRLVEMLVALILSKFVVASVLALGANAVGGGGEDGALTGAAMLLLAGFAPFVLFKMVPIIEAGAIGHLEGVSRRPFQAATRAAHSAKGLADGPIGAALRIGRSSGGPSIGSSGVGAQNIGDHPGEYTPGMGGVLGAVSGGQSGGGGLSGGASGSGASGGPVPGGGSAGSGGGGSVGSGGGSPAASGGESPVRSDGRGSGGAAPNMGAPAGAGSSGGSSPESSALAGTHQPAASPSAASSPRPVGYRPTRSRPAPRPPGPVAPTVASEPPRPPGMAASAGGEAR